MKIELLEKLRCPKSGRRLTLDASDPNSGVGQEVESGWLVADNGQHRYPIRNGIPRFVPESNYADNFGMQWNHFRQTQLDSHSGHSISADRFWKATNWREADLSGHWVLDAGCGAGRFAEVALNAGAKVLALDYSSAVDACYANLRHNPNLHMVQGDIYSLPLQKESFPFVYSLGVLQHTPDVEKAFAALPPLVEPGGRLCVDFYEKTWKSSLLPKYWLRPITKRLPKPFLFSLLKLSVPVMLPVSRALGMVPFLGGALKRVVPVVNYHGILPLDPKSQQEWSLLDTFDMFSPAFDSPQEQAVVRSWMEAAKLNEIEMLYSGHLVMRGRK